MRDLSPIHPGEQPREEFLKPLGLTAHRLAKDSGVSVIRVLAIVAERPGITGDTAFRLARCFGTMPGPWLHEQRGCELKMTVDALGSRLEREFASRVSAGRISGPAIG